MTDLSIHRFIWPTGIAIASLGILLLSRGLAIRYWKQWAKKYPQPFTKAAIELIRTPSLYWCVILSVYLSLDFANLNPQQAKQVAQLIYIALILSITLVLSNLATAAFKHFVGASNGLLLGLLRTSVLSVGILITLSLLGISIAPLLTALGLGGLALALALKDTLENLFAGIYLISEGALRVGDVIRIDPGVEGVILDFGWRTTRIKLGNHNVTLIPNSKLAQNIVTNFSLPERKFVSNIAVNVSEKAELGVVEKLLLDIGRKASEDIVGVLTAPEPSVLFLGVNGDGMGFTLTFWVREYKEQGFACNELRKRIYLALKAANIPLPQRELFIGHLSGQSTIEKSP